jgi:hypothetical protein
MNRFGDQDVDERHVRAARAALGMQSPDCIPRAEVEELKRKLETAEHEARKLWGQYQLKSRELEDIRRRLVSVTTA